MSLCFTGLAHTPICSGYEKGGGVLLPLVSLLIFTDKYRCISPSVPSAVFLYHPRPASDSAPIFLGKTMVSKCDHWFCSAARVQFGPLRWWGSILVPHKTAHFSARTGRFYGPYVEVVFLPPGCLGTLRHGVEHGE